MPVKDLTRHSTTNHRTCFICDDVYSSLVVANDDGEQFLHSALHLTFFILAGDVPCHVRMKADESREGLDDHWILKSTDGFCLTHMLTVTFGCGWGWVEPVAPRCHRSPPCSEPCPARASGQQILRPPPRLRRSRQRLRSRLPRRRSIAWRRWTRSTPTASSWRQRCFSKSSLRIAGWIPSVLWPMTHQRPPWLMGISGWQTG